MLAVRLPPSAVNGRKAPRPANGQRSRLDSYSDKPLRQQPFIF
jgi:hypothetical protein